MNKIIFLIIIVLSSQLTTVVFAGDRGLGEAAQQAGIGTSGRNPIQVTAGNVIGSLLSFVGVLFFLTLLYAGVTYMLARGNEERAAKARKTITYSIIGILLVIAAYAITQFVGQFTSVS